MGDGDVPSLRQPEAGRLKTTDVSITKQLGFVTRSNVQIPSKLHVVQMETKSDNRGTLCSQDQAGTGLVRSKVWNACRVKD